MAGMTMASLAMASPAHPTKPGTMASPADPTMTSPADPTSGRQSKNSLKRPADPTSGRQSKNSLKGLGGQRKNTQMLGVDMGTNLFLEEHQEKKSGTVALHQTKRGS